MKKIAALLACCTIALSAFAQDDSALIDEPFALIVQRALTLKRVAQAWNTQCGGNESQDCKDAAARLRASLEEFVAVAKLYVPVVDPTSECDTSIRGRIVAHEVKDAEWNLKWGGKKKTPEESAQAEKEFVDDFMEALILKKDIDECIKTETKIEQPKPISPNFHPQTQKL